MARPKLPRGQARDEVFRMRLTRDELALLKSLAKQSGKNPAVYAREKVLR